MVQTEKLIVKAFLSLVDEKPLRSITVRDITDTCHINRNTFYYHFSSISGLIGYMIREQFDALLFSRPVEKQAEDYLLPLAHALLNDKKTALHIYRSLSRETVQTEFPDAVRYAVSQYLKLSGTENRPDLEILTMYYASVLSGILLTWMEMGLPPELENIAKQMIQLIRNS